MGVVLLARRFPNPRPSDAASLVPSGLNAILRIVASWPSNAMIFAPVSTSRIVTPVTWPGTAKVDPSGLKETPLT